MFALILATLIAQVPEASPPPEASPSASASTAAPPPDVMPGRATFPRGPRRVPQEVPSLAADDVLVRNSGSTNAAGYAIVIHKNFTADVAGERKPVGEAQAKWLYAKLDEAKPFARLGMAHCMKSASFGSTTTITYEGETTTDLSCPGGPESRELMRTIGVIVTQLGVDTRPGSRAMRL